MARKFIQNLKYNLKYVCARILSCLSKEEEMADPGHPKWKNNPWYKVFLARRDYALQFIKNKKVLDLCCGAGWFTHQIAKQAKHVYGVDNSKDTISYAEKNYSADNINYKVMDALNLDFKDNFFDVVVTFEALEHFTQEDGLNYLREARRVLKKGGLLIGSTPAITDERKAKYLMAKNKYHLCLYTKFMLENILKKVFSAYEIIFKKEKYFLFKVKK